MRILSFVRKNPIMILLLSGIGVCLLLLGLIVSAEMGIAIAKECLRSGVFYVSLFIVFITPFLIVSALADKRTGKPPKCRGCNLEKPFTITYETNGVCRECLDEALKLQGLGDKT